MNVQGVMTTESRKSQVLWLVLTVTLVGAAQLYCLEGEQLRWHNDTASYVKHAENIKSGDPYPFENYVLSPVRFLAPKAYPWGYPLLLAPIVDLGGDEKRPVRYQLVLFIILTCIVVWFYSTEKLPFVYAAAAVCLFGIHPLITSLTTFASSHLPYTFFLVAALVGYSRLGRSTDSLAYQNLTAIVLGVICALCVATRPHGYLLLVVLPVYELFSRRKRFRFLILTLGSGALVFFALKFLFVSPLNATAAEALGPRGTGYGSLIISQLRWDGLWERLLRNGLTWTESVLFLWRQSDSTLWVKFVTLVTGIFALRGYVLQCKKGMTAAEWYVPLHGLSLLAFSFSQVIYLIPILPFYFYYIVLGTRFESPVWSTIAQPTLLILVIVTYLPLNERYFRASETVFVEPESKAVYSFLNSNVGEDELIMTFFVRPMAYFTDRRTTTSNLNLFGDQLDAYVETMEVDYFVVGPPYAKQRRQQDRFDAHRALVASDTSRFERMFANRLYQVYRVNR